MGSTATDRGRFYAEVAAEFRQHYRRGPRFVAVTGVPEADAAGAADALAEALRAAGDTVERVSVTADTAADPFRAEVVAPSRTREGVLVVDGPGLLAPEFRGFWNFSLWVEHDPERSPDWSFVATGRKDPLGAPREVASVLLDDADPARPRRLFADSC
ncbi:hypothetical protein IT072_16480 [Leifsonia sp. ZF2019]|uniref:hypothetical protein n=1 Tax=Leifsonia sp. ZF2019 TaxID=2781978 RepID=UPI001CBF2A22|nr:hypothetical protein [Leifsonia sp. ZF2019]UAJ78809.1 hypothetical protein IT072_16480 [Leifsonia sp. ZF2019]